MGGHNPVEPAYNNCVVITGPHIYNWENVFLDMMKNKACFLCDNIDKLNKVITNLLNDKKKINILKIRSKKFTKSNFFETEKLISIINKNFKKIKC